MKQNISAPTLKTLKCAEKVARKLPTTIQLHRLPVSAVAAAAPEKASSQKGSEIEKHKMEETKRERETKRHHKAKTMTQRNKRRATRGMRNTIDDEQKTTPSGDAWEGRR